jgi:hypothetical protein
LASLIRSTRSVQAPAICMRASLVPPRRIAEHTLHCADETKSEIPLDSECFPPRRGQYRFRRISCKGLPGVTSVIWDQLGTFDIPFPGSTQ